MPKQATIVSGDLPKKAEPKWLNEEEREGWLFISSIIFNLTRQLDNQLQQDADLSYVEYMVLVGLSESEDHELTIVISLSYFLSINRIYLKMPSSDNIFNIITIFT